MNKLDEKLLATYNYSLSTNGINGERIAKRLDELSKIGKVDSGGASRYGYSPEEQAAHESAKKWLEEAGAEIEVDGAGNLIGHIKGKSDAKTYASGSHLDTVPNGGHFDGVVGVLTAIEIAQAWKDEGVVPPYGYDILIFREEEGSQFNMGLLGSTAFMGLNSKDTLSQLKATTTNVSLTEMLERNHLAMHSFIQAKKNRKYELYLETHIEQGKLLENANQPVGVVTGIAGIAYLNFTFTGVSDHAGNTPMNDRFDPLVAAGRFIYEISTLPGQISDSAVATVGKLKVSPNGANVIAEKVEVTVDIRGVTLEHRLELERLITERAIQLADEHAVSVAYYQTTDIDPVDMDGQLQAELKAIIKEITQEEALSLPSGANHDATSLAKEYPVAMLFIKSRKGISHHPEEWSDLSDIVTGVQVSKQFLEKKMQDSQK